MCEITMINLRTFAGIFDELNVLVLAHFCLYVALVVFVKPESQVSIGLHEKTGNCESVTQVQTASGMVSNISTYCLRNGK